MSNQPDIPPRVAQLLAEHAARKTRLRATRATFKARRDAGLAKRHARKTARS